MSLLSRLAVQAARAYGILSSADKTKVVADYLVVAGGGGGGSGGGSGGGGGAGGLLTSTATLSTLNTYSIAVGSGGAGSVNTTSIASSGTNSSLSGTGLTTVTAIGGGGGASDDVNFPQNTGGSGGSGGGGGGGGTGGSTGGAGTSGQGFAGGYSTAGGSRGGGGGGGSSAVGSISTNANGANGGAGTASSISGSSVTYAGGGGGGTQTGTAGTATGGGGAGSVGNTAATAGTANTGGGGGGRGFASGGPAGGSGIVIISYTSATPKFVGGTITTSGGKQIHTFTSSGTLSPLTPITASYLVVAGGGGAATNIGGGGGAGGYQASSTTLYSGATYVVTVGAGGSGGASGGDNAGSNGSNSVVSGTGLTTLTSVGGGGGGKNGTPTGAGNGGSGGGAGEGSSYGTGTSGQGNNGGTAYDAGGAYGGGGGGGASAVGANGSSSSGGNGGAGTASSISGTSTTYAGGGGGGGIGTVGSGGAGGGGNANATSGGAGSSGTPNTGGGGGAGGGSYGAGGAGGSGIVIISYAGSQAFNGGLVTSSGGNTIHTFTSTGALTPLTNNLNNSLRFRSSASARLSRTFATTGTNNKIQTFSAWVKRGLLSSSTTYRLMGCYDGSSSNSTEINFTNDNLKVEFGGAANNALTSTQVFRDPSAWYHIVIAIDTTQATAANRVKMYVNGNQVTAFSTANYPSQNAASQLTSANANNSIGAGWSGFEYFDGYMTDINFIDGQALEPYYFGNNDANGVWKPIQYKGTYGTNGFYLTFGNTTSTTTLGYDSSPNGNNWTCNNISLTAGTTYDAMTDVPTNTSATVANYCVLNPLIKTSTGWTMSNGNLTLTDSSSGGSNQFGTIAVNSGKYYFECSLAANTDFYVGVGYISTLSIITAYRKDGTRFNGSGFVAYGASYTTNDVIGCAFDVDSGTVEYFKNGTSQGQITGISYSSGSVTSEFYSVTGGSYNANYGQRGFAYTPPTGYVALNTYNLPTPTILQGNKYMDATTYTGNGSTQVIVNQGQFQPDLVWDKARSNTDTNSNMLVNSTTGRSKSLSSNQTSTEGTSSAGYDLVSFNSNGFTVGPASQGDFNTSGWTFVGWQWKANGGTTSSNTSGSITSTVQANTTSGFSIVTYTGTGANATVGHGLGVAPAMIITRYRGIESWSVYHKSLGGTKTLYLDLTNAANTTSLAWNNTDPTSTVFSVGSAGTTNTSGGSGMLALCWAEISGYSKFGSYTGNGSSDGVFVYLGFKPKFIMIKCTDTAGTAWVTYDTARDTYNQMTNILLPNSSSAELSGYSLDVLSNGFKHRQGGGDPNASSRNYVYACFAEHPFKNSNAR